MLFRGEDCLQVAPRLLGGVTKQPRQAPKGRTGTSHARSPKDQKTEAIQTDRYSAMNGDRGY